MAVIASIAIANIIIITQTEPFLYENPDAIPENKVALLLGTSRYLKSGGENQYFTNRINAAVELYKKKKISYILASGDNSTKYYDEPTEMKKSLMEKGVPEEAIYTDYAGLRTLDSIIRVKDIFGQNAITIISQKFHNQRATYIATQHNIEAVGYNAKDFASGKSKARMWLRESLARIKALLDIHILHKKPKFLGDTVSIG